MNINPKSLFFKVFAGVWITLMLFSLTPIFFFLMGTQDNRDTFYHIARREIEKKTHISLRNAVTKGDLESVDKLVSKMEEKLAVNIYIFDKDKHEIENKEYPESIMGLINDMKDGKVLLIKRIKDPEGHEKVVRAMRSGDYLMVSYPAHDRKPSYLPILLMHHIRMFIQVFVLSIIASFILVRYLVKPLMTLSNASRKIADGDFSVRVSKQVKSSDELGRLAADFDIMADKLQKNRENQESMMRNISHELRSPLTRLRLSLELARAKAAPDAHTALDRIEKESERLNEMIGKLLEISRIRAHETTNDQVLSLSDILLPVINDCAFEADETGKLLRNTASSSVKLKGNKELMMSSVENVVRNAIKYSKQTVEISTEVVSDSVNIIISDDGCGVPEENLADIFTPFYRVQDDRDRKTGGTGLGLAIAKAVVEAHNGSIHAENNDKGGLSITICLPVA